MIEIDGSIGEGGGQILRNAVAMAALLGRPLRVYNIRAKRNPPGLRPQHLTALKAVAEMSGAYAEGLHVGSTEITFKPKSLRAGRFAFDAGTAGSTTLMLQSLLPVMCFANGEVEVELRGGTDNPLAPPVDYMNLVLLPVLKLMGVNASVELVRRGFYPRGGGIVRARTTPCKRVKPIELLKCGEVEEVLIHAYSSNLPAHIVDRMVRTAEEMLRAKGLRNVSANKEVLQRGDPKCAMDPGTGIVVAVKFDNGAVIGGDALGERGLPAEQVAKKAVDVVIRQLELKVPVDPHLSDQLIIWAGLADGTSRYKVSEITSHTSTSMEIVRRVLGAEFGIEKVDGVYEIVCKGISFTRS